MIEPLDGVPPGTLGFRATGKVTGDEYRDTLLPAPGEVLIRDLDGLEQAEAWVAG